MRRVSANTKILHLKRLRGGLIHPFIILCTSLFITLSVWGDEAGQAIEHYQAAQSYFKENRLDDAL
ncbi:MAG: hypothetical protein V3W51_02415, partial [Candidatus Brocadiales bacterium]